MSSIRIERTYELHVTCVVEHIELEEDPRAMMVLAMAGLPIPKPKEVVTSARFRADSKNEEGKTMSFDGGCRFDPHVFDADARRGGWAYKAAAAGFVAKATDGFFGAALGVTDESGLGKKLQRIGARSAALACLESEISILHSDLHNGSERELKLRDALPFLEEMVRKAKRQVGAEE